MICLVKRENRELTTDTEGQRVNDTDKLLDMKASVTSICHNGDALYRTVESRYLVPVTCAQSLTKPCRLAQQKSGVETIRPFASELLRAGCVRPLAVVSHAIVQAALQKDQHEPA
jgi:hypothetical protein